MAKTVRNLVMLIVAKIHILPVEYCDYINLDDFFSKFLDLDL